MHPSAFLFRVSAASSTRVGIVSSRVSNPSVSSSRQFHVSQAALKKKAKTVQNNALFDGSDDSDADELFGSSKPEPKNQKKSVQPLAAGLSPKRRVSPTSGTRLVDDKTAELLRQKENQRREAFQSSYEYLYERTGDAGKQSAALPAKRALHNLVNNAVSPEEWQRTISILKQWRRYPTRPIPTGVQELFIRRATSTGNASLLLDVLTHHPAYAIHISSPSVARALLKEMVTPVNSYPPSYSSNEKDTAAFSQRLEQALRLAEVLSITQAEGSTTTLSPSKDAILGPLLLCSLLRVASMSIPGEDTAALAQAIQQLVNDMRHVQSSETEPASGALSAQETLWGIAALRECETALKVDSVRKLLEAHSTEEETPKMTVDEMINHLSQARQILLAGNGERGGVARRKMETAASALKEGPSTKLSGGAKAGKKGKSPVPSHLLGKDGGSTSERRV